MILWTRIAVAFSPAADQVIGPVGTLGLGPRVDLDADGYDDLLVDAQGAPTPGVDVLFGGPLGLDPVPVHLPLPGPVLAALDADADGIPELVVGHYPESYIYVGGARALGAPSVVLPISVGSAEVGDFDADGYDDLAVHDTSLTRIEVRAGGPSGIPAAGTVVQLGVLRDLAVLDVDGDGHDDLVHPWFGALRVWSGGPGGLSAAPTATVPTPSAYTNGLLASGDVDGDGDEDLLVADQARWDGPWHHYLHLGGPGGLGAAVAALPSTNRFEPISATRVEDLDGDGAIEVLVGRPSCFSPGSPDGAAVIGWSTGGLAVVDLVLGDSGQCVGGAVASGDYDGDGRPDWAVADSADVVGVDLSSR